MTHSMKVYRESDIVREPPHRWRLVRVESPGMPTRWHIEKRYKLLWWSWWWVDVTFSTAYSEDELRKEFTAHVARQKEGPKRTVIESA